MNNLGKLLVIYNHMSFYNTDQTSLLNLIVNFIPLPFLFFFLFLFHISSMYLIPYLHTPSTSFFHHHHSPSPRGELSLPLSPSLFFPFFSPFLSLSLAPSPAPFPLFFHFIFPPTSIIQHSTSNIQHSSSTTSFIYLSIYMHKTY